MKSFLAIPPFKEAKIYNGEKEWFVYYNYYSRKKKKYIREKIRIASRGLNSEQRLVLLKQVRDELNTMIRKQNARGIYLDESAGSDSIFRGIESLAECAKILKEHEEISVTSRKNIGYFLFSYEKFIKDYPAFSTMTAAEIDAQFIKQFIKFLQSQGKASKTINSYLWAIQLITEELVRREQIERKFDTSPFRVRHIKNETGRYRPLTAEEKTIVFDHFRETRPEFYLYLLCIYYTCIRPAELRRLKVSYFDFEGKKIKTPWFTAKNGLSNYVQMFTPLHEALTDLAVDKLDKKLYLFSRLFKPGEEQYTGKWASDIWRSACKKLDLPSDANMYGLKHTFNVDYVENNKYNLDWEFLRRHNRHATVQQTQQYISGLTAYFLDETQSIILNYHTTS